MSELVRKQSRFEQVEIRIRERAFRSAVVAGLMMLYAVMTSIVAERQQEVIVEIVPRAEERTSLRNQIAICSLVGGRHRQPGFAFAHHLDHMLRRLARLGEFDVAIMRARDQRRIDERSERDRLELDEFIRAAVRDSSDRQSCPEFPAS